MLGHEDHTHGRARPRTHRDPKGSDSLFTGIKESLPIPPLRNKVPTTEDVGHEPRTRIRINLWVKCRALKYEVKLARVFMAGIVRIREICTKAKSLAQVKTIQRLFAELGFKHEK